MQTIPIVRSEQRIPLVASPLVDCAWCHRARYPGVDFPRDLSSTICPGHMTWMLAQAAQRRTQRSEVNHA
jgi:hypothetical protein